MQSPKESSHPTSFVGQATSAHQSIPNLETYPLLPHDLLQEPRYPKMYREVETFTEDRMQLLLGKLRTCFDERADIRKRTLRIYDSRVDNW